MITKELFIELINTIQEQAKAEEKFCNAFSDYANSGEYPPIISNRLLTPLFKLLEETIDPSEIIEWWLYDIDDGNKFVYENVGDDEIEYNLNDIADLYEYIAGNFSEVKSRKYKSKHEKEQTTTKTLTMEQFQELVKEKIKNNK